MICSFLLLLLSTTAYEIRGIGSDLALNLIHSWLHDYQLKKPQISLAYTVSEDDDAVDVFQGFNADFIGDEHPLEIPDTFAFPIMSQPIVFQVNLPEIPQQELLILDRHTIANIFCNQVNNWRHLDILNTNPHLQSILPNTTIQIIVQKEADEIPKITRLFANWSSVFNETVGTIDEFPDFLTNLSNWHVTESIREAYATLVLTPYSLSVTHMSVKSTREEERYVHFINQAGQTVGPDGTVVPVEPGSHAYLTGFIGDSNHLTAYPFIELFFFSFPTNYNNRDCNKYREILKWVRWFLFDPIPLDRADEAGGMIFEQLRLEIWKNLTQLKCDGVELASLQDLRTIDTGFYVSTAVAIIILVMVLSLSIFHTYWFRSSRIHLSYSLALVFGSTITLIAPLFWFIKPNTNAICLSRAWLTSLGCVILLASMFSRTWQLHTIYRLDKNKSIGNLKQMNPIANAIWKLFLALSVFVLLDVFILIAWTVQDPYHAKFLLSDELELLGNWACKSNNLTVWMALQTLLISIMIAFGIVVIYQTWHFTGAKAVNETRWVLIALYNIILVVTALAPLLVLAKLNDTTLALVMGIAIDFSALGVIFAVFLPRVYYKWVGSKSDNAQHQRSNSSTHSDKGKKENSRNREMSTEMPKVRGLTPYNGSVGAPHSPHSLIDDSASSRLVVSDIVLPSPSSMMETRHLMRESSPLSSSTKTSPQLFASQIAEEEVPITPISSIRPIRESSQSDLRGTSRTEGEPEALNTPIFNPFS